METERMKQLVVALIWKEYSEQIRSTFRSFMLNESIWSPELGERQVQCPICGMTLEYDEKEADIASNHVIGDKKLPAIRWWAHQQDTANDQIELIKLL